MRRSLVAAVAALTLGAGTSAAQDSCRRYVREPDVGGWSSYEVAQREQPKGEMRFALVGREERAGTAMHRFEMTVRDEAGKEQMTMQLLVPGWPYDPGAIEEMVMQPAGQGPMRVGGQMLGMMKTQLGRDDAMAAAKACDAMEYLGRQTVTVPGGTFDAAHYRDAASGTEVWATDEVPFGFVKSLDPKGNRMLLTGHGDGAKSAITGTPKPMGG